MNQLEIWKTILLNTLKYKMLKLEANMLKRIYLMTPVKVVYENSHLNFGIGIESYI